MDLSTAYRYNQNMMEYYTCKLTTRAVLRTYFSIFLPPCDFFCLLEILDCIFLLIFVLIGLHLS